MPNPPRPRAESPIFRMFEAGRRVLGAERDLIGATQDALAAHEAGACLTCGDPVDAPERGEARAKLCGACSGDVAQAGAELGARAVAPVLEAVLGELLGGRRKLAPRR